MIIILLFITLIHWWEYWGFDLKVVENNEPMASESTIWDSKPLPAYQYFENVRNFLMAVKELKLPAFEASDLVKCTYPICIIILFV